MGYNIKSDSTTYIRARYNIKIHIITHRLFNHKQTNNNNTRKIEINEICGKSIYTKFNENIEDCK